MTTRRTVPATHRVNPGGESAGPHPIGSREWAERWRLEVQSIWTNVPKEAERLARFWELGIQHEVWKLLSRPDGTPHESFDEFCRGRYPWGLARPTTTQGQVERWIAMVSGRDTGHQHEAHAVTACAPLRPPGYYWVRLSDRANIIIAEYHAHPRLGPMWHIINYEDDIEEEHVEVLGPVAPYEPAPSTAQLARKRALQDAVRDAMENGAFASVGGLGKRTEMTLPSWITPEDGPAYIDGYKEAGRRLYGDDWQTCEFGWKPAVKIPGTEGEPT